METQILKPVIRIERQSIYDGIQRGYYSWVNIPSNVTMLPDSEVPKLIECGILPSYATIGQTFLQSPYGEKEYFTIDDYEIAIMNKKAHHIEMLAAMLGATHSEYKIHLTSCQRRSLDAALKTKITTTKIDANYKEEVENNINHSIQVESDYRGIIPTAEDYEQALLYIKEHNLINDASAQDILTFRNPNKINTNFVSKRNVSIQLCQELNKNMDFAAQLCSMDGVINIDADFVKKVAIKKEATMEFIVQFAMPN